MKYGQHEPHADGKRQDHGYGESIGIKPRYIPQKGITRGIEGTQQEHEGPDGQSDVTILPVIAPKIQARQQENTTGGKTQGDRAPGQRYGQDMGHDGPEGQKAGTVSDRGLNLFVDPKKRTPCHRMNIQLI
jgi:hypothetical protein